MKRERRTASGEPASVPGWPNGFLRSIERGRVTWGSPAVRLSTSRNPVEHSVNLTIHYRGRKPFGGIGAGVFPEHFSRNRHQRKSRQLMLAGRIGELIPGSH